MDRQHIPAAQTAHHRQRPKQHQRRPWLHVPLQQPRPQRPQRPQAAPEALLFTDSVAVLDGLAQQRALKANVWPMVNTTASAPLRGRLIRFGVYSVADVRVKGASSSSIANLGAIEKGTELLYICDERCLVDTVYRGFSKSVYTSLHPQRCLFTNRSDVAMQYSISVQFVDR